MPGRRRGHARAAVGDAFIVARVAHDLYLIARENDIHRGAARAHILAGATPAGAHRDRRRVHLVAHRLAETSARDRHDLLLCAPSREKCADRLIADVILKRDPGLDPGEPRRMKSIFASFEGRASRVHLRMTLRRAPSPVRGRGRVESAFQCLPECPRLLRDGPAALLRMTAKRGWRAGWRSLVGVRDHFEDRGGRLTARQQALIQRSDSAPKMRPTLRTSRMLICGVHTAPGPASIPDCLSGTYVPAPGGNPSGPGGRSGTARVLQCE